MTASEKSQIQVSELGEEKTVNHSTIQIPVGEGVENCNECGNICKTGSDSRGTPNHHMKITDYCTLWTPPTKHNPKGNSRCFLVWKTFQYKIRELMLFSMPESTLCLFINASHRCLLLVLSLFSIGTYCHLNMKCTPCVCFRHLVPSPCHHLEQAFSTCDL